MQRPTGSAVVSDIVFLARQIEHGIQKPMVLFSTTRPDRKEISIEPIEALRSSYYFRFSALDKPGVLSKISGILGRHGISIHSVIQKGRKVKGSVPVVMLTHEACESSVLKALGQLDQLDVLTDKTHVIRVEEG